MKDTFLDANFPKTADGRVYHLGLRMGEVANRIIAVGPPSRAEDIATFLDERSEDLFRLTSERAFLTITGHYKGVPVSVVSIGMGYPNMDFVVREVRECVQGDMVMVRIGSCGCLDESLPVGSLVVPSASVAVNRNYDFDFQSSSSNDGAYLISKPVPSDSELNSTLQLAFSSSNSTPSVCPEPSPKVQIKCNTVNASADSFYSSQGRLTSFLDRNEDLIECLQAKVPNLSTLEMETFHLFHLASVWRPRPVGKEEEEIPHLTIPPTNLPVDPSISPRSSRFAPLPPSSGSETANAHERKQESSSGGKKNANANETETENDNGTPPARIRAAAVHMVFANRITGDFVTPERAEILQKWAGEKVLQALAGFEVHPSKLHPEDGSVWEK